MDQLNTNGGTSTVPSPATSNAAGTDAVYEEKVRKLAKLTQRGTIEWHIIDASSVPTLSFARVLTAYEAAFGGEKLRLTETGYEKRNLSVMLRGLSSLFPSNTNEMGSIALSLHLLDQNDRPTFKFPSVKAIYDLFSEIKMKQLDVDHFLNAIDAAAATTEEQQKQIDN